MVSEEELAEEADSSGTGTTKDKDLGSCHGVYIFFGCKL